ncbi:hypothetical protein SUGI_1481530 [Cryptomeria japonica]|uniref:Uncharacterized protein n=1 Tax=Cryptomeria japonica TaxID=3369 RepID=A0AAD3NVK1_CRYJA|nr:hypothetical protein SUGI_1479520 [Cryptomeria japonica]GLJ58872.1 hypothetical protein SUGI_1481530 [Cryptomeria japonica]
MKAGANEWLTNFSVGKNSHSSIYRFELINKGAGARVGGVLSGTLKPPSTASGGTRVGGALNSSEIRIGSLASELPKCLGEKE